MATWIFLFPRCLHLQLLEIWSDSLGSLALQLQIQSPHVPGLAVFPSGADPIGFTAPDVKASELAAAMKISNLRIKAVWTLRDNSGGMYSLGILLPGISKHQLTLNALCCSLPKF